MCARLMPLSVAPAVILLGALVGCTTSIPHGGGGAGQLSAEFGLGGGLGTFQVQAGQPADNHGTGNFEITGATVTEGSVVIDPAVITVTPANGGPDKAGPTLQAGEPLIITVWIAPIDQVDTVCGGGEQYGPFEVVLDENYVPVSIDPSEVTLTSTTVDLLNVGEFAICLRVVSPIDGTVDIASLTFTLQ